MSLYLWLDLLAIFFPFLLSFEKNLRYYKKWGFLFSATFLTMVPFLIWDAIFIKKGIWGFNPRYLTGLELISLPLEEILFFFVVPYASLFAFYAIRFHFPKYKVTKKLSRLITIVLSAAAILIAAFNIHHLYTLVNFSFFAAVLITVYCAARELLNAFYAIFPVLLIPFFIMNGLLTGTGIVDEIVWYNPDEIMGLRLGTIPVEDIFYTFSLLVIVLVLKEWLEKLWGKSA